MPICDGDEQWFALLVDQAVVVPGPVTDAIGAAARAAGVHVVVGVDEREPHGTSIYNTTVYLGPDGTLVGKHRKLMPTPCGAWATAQPSRSSTLRTAGSAG